MIRSFIQELGGPTAVAKAIAAASGAKLKPKTVCEWARSDTIPYRWRPFVLRLAEQEAEKQGKEIPVPPEIRAFMQ